MISDEWWCRIAAVGLMTCALLGRDLWGMSELAVSTSALGSFVFMVGAMVLKAIDRKPYIYTHLHVQQPEGGPGNGKRQAQDSGRTAEGT